MPIWLSNFAKPLLSWDCEENVSYTPASFSNWLSLISNCEPSKALLWAKSPENSGFLTPASSVGSKPTHLPLFARLI
jgi:hypothetical protein